MLIPHGQLTAEGVLMAMVLVVEDEVFVRMAAEDTIGSMGHSILLASDVAEALSHLSSANRIDALFVDMRLSAAPLGGCEVADQAVRGRPELRVLYTSGRPLSDDMAQLFVGGARFLQKPYSPRDLQDSVGDLLSGPSPNAAHH